VDEVMVRRAGLDDIDALAEIHVAGYELAHRGLVPDEMIEVRTPELRRRVWRERLSAPQEGDVVLVAEVDGKVLGFASFHPATPSEAGGSEATALWENLYLDPSYVGSSVAPSFYDAMVPVLREQGFAEVVAFVADGNQRIARFFKRRGFRFDGASRESEGVRELRMRRPLD
jgi:L-amino acid N-acyltransferase YncA